ncbi:hypothetical protein IBX65_05715 [Candidatus Aerophobetes bacterium]|nr:hypothetical protein [Candidatus Aerophobetes bacterium]
MKKKRLVALVVLTGFFILGGILGGECEVSTKSWQAFEFRGDERFEYRVSWEMGEEEKEAIYILDIRKSDERTAEGEAIFDVSYTTKGKLRKEDLGPEAAFGLWSIYGVSLNILVLNPAYGFFFSQVDMKVGEKISFYGAGAVKIPGKETIAGRDGFVCQFLQTVDEKEELVAEWVIDPGIALPLRSRVFEEGELLSQIELIRYNRY